MTVIIRDKGCMASSIGYYLILVGAVNWGLVGLGGFFGADWNIVHMIFGGIPVVESAVYVIVGIAGVMTFIGCKCKTCVSCQVNATCDAPKV